MVFISRFFLFEVGWRGYQLQVKRMGQNDYMP